MTFWCLSTSNFYQKKDFRFFIWLCLGIIYESRIFSRYQKQKSVLFLISCIIFVLSDFLHKIRNFILESAQEERERVHSAQLSRAERESVQLRGEIKQVRMRMEAAQAHKQEFEQLRTKLDQRFDIDIFAFLYAFRFYTKSTT